jgi:6,7-dimethyl-8-ribityllumazine synthase
MSVIHAPARNAVRIPGPAPRLLLIQAPYYDQVVGGMRRGAERAFAEAGATLEVVDVAGAFELPAALRMALSQKASRYDGYLILGCVVKGETDHYDHICRETCNGVMGIAAETGAAIGFGLLTVHTLQQALERSAEDKFNKGAESAHALLMQVALRRRWGIQ